MTPPVRFFCKRCSLMMKVGSKMFGRIVVCPQCGERIEVPFESDPKAEELYRFMKLKRAEEKAASSVGTSATVDRTGFEHLEPDEVDRWIDEFWATVSEGDGAVRVPHPLRRDPDGVVEVADESTGKARFRFNVLLLIVCLLGACGGFLLHFLLIGLSERPPPTETAPQVPIVVEGRLHYQTAEGQRIPDADAVILFLPSDRVPAVAISCVGLRPDDNGSTSGLAAQTIEELGGAFRRTGADGSFAFSLPGEGRFLVLAISSHLRRPEADPATLRQLQRFFRDPADLLRDFSFVCEEYDIDRGTTILRYTFTSL